MAPRQGKTLGEKKGSIRLLVEVVINISHLLIHPTICIFSLFDLNTSLKMATYSANLFVPSKRKMTIHRAKENMRHTNPYTCEISQAYRKSTNTVKLFSGQSVNFYNLLSSTSKSGTARM